MQDKGLFVFVEGADDERFIKYIFRTKLRERFSWIKFYQYSQRKPEKICAFIRSIHAMNANYLFFADIDMESCVTSKKEKLVNRYQGLDPLQTEVVIVEIESWYIAGIAQDTSVKLSLKQLPEHTNNFTKENFNQLVPKKFDSRIDFMREILKYFSFKQAKLANTSFMHFANRYDE